MICSCDLCWQAPQLCHACRMHQSSLCTTTVDQCLWICLALCLMPSRTHHYLVMSFELIFVFLPSYLGLHPSISLVILGESGKHFHNWNMFCHRLPWFVNQATARTFSYSKHILCLSGLMFCVPLVCFELFIMSNPLVCCMVVA